jgi:hypothetical protein
MSRIKHFFLSAGGAVMPAGRKPKKLPKDSANGATAAERVCWLLKTRFKGNRRALAEGAGVSHSSIVNVANGQQPGRRLMESITANLKINPAWLLNGEGEPSAEPLKQPGIPIARKLLPGAPADFPDLLLGDWIDDAATLFTPMQYWLLLTTDQPILRDPIRGFRAGDLLLLETDRLKFPRESHLSNHLCVVRFDESGTETHKLGVVSFIPGSIEDGPQRLEMDCYELDPDPSSTVVEQVYRHFPGGRIDHLTRPLRSVPFRGQERYVSPDRLEIEPALPKIRYADIVSVWLQHLRRPLTTLL